MGEGSRSLPFSFGVGRDALGAVPLTTAGGGPRPPSTAAAELAVEANRQTKWSAEVGFGGAARNAEMALTASSCEVDVQARPGPAVGPGRHRIATVRRRATPAFEHEPA